jgi:hypothetical protein
LGVHSSGAEVEFDASAPDARIREAITMAKRTT